jgi:hypothetical protein
MVSILGHGSIQIPVFPAQVVTHQWPGLQRAIIGVRKRLDEKKPSLPKFSPGFNGPRGMPPPILAFRHKIGVS